MEENVKGAFGPSVLRGVYLGVALILFSLILYLLGIDRESPVQYVSYLILIVGLAWSIFAFRNKDLGGFCTYGKAFSAGFYTALIASLLTGIYTFINVTAIDPGMIGEILLRAEEGMLASNPNMTDDQLEIALSWTEMMTTPIMMSVFNFIGNLLVSTILSLIIAIFAKRENNQIA